MTRQIRRPSKAIAAFIRRLAAVTDPEMQEALWAERFATRGEASDGIDELLELLSRLLAGVRRRDEPYRTAYMSLVVWLRRTGNQQPRSREAEVQYNRRRAAYESASEIGDVDVMRLLLPTAPAPMSIATHIREPALGGEGQEITLGHRRMMARTADRALIGRLLFDPDSKVLKHLLDNPLMVEQDVVRVAARRPTLASSLEVVFNHPRWGRRAEVQRALLLNPYSPVDIGMGLLPLMDRRQLKEVARDSLLSPALRRRAQEIQHLGSTH